MRAGTLVPATLYRRRHGLVILSALNEGRNFSSGNTTESVRRQVVAWMRSMRAGTLVPATPDRNDPEFKPPFCAQ